MKKLYRSLLFLFLIFKTYIFYKFFQNFLKKFSKKFLKIFSFFLAYSCICSYTICRDWFSNLSQVPRTPSLFFTWFLPNISWKFRHLKVFTFVFISILSFLRSENFYINIHFFHFLTLIHLFTFLHFYIVNVLTFVTF